MKRFVMIVLVALLFGVTSAKAELGYEQKLDSGWNLQIWDEKNVWQGCSVGKIFTGPEERITLGFLLGYDSFKIGLVFEKAPFFVSGEEQVEYAFRVDGDKIFRGNAAIQKDVAFLTLDWNLEIVREVQEGKQLEIKIAEKSYSFPLVGSRIALNTLMECYKLGLKSRQGKGN